MKTIALVGNPNSGKSTLFNALTGARQYIGNWPGVTVEKKTGVYRKNEEIALTDLPGIYSLSPYTPEEVIARNYLLHEHPDVVLNIVDASNLERNLYLTTQLMEMGIPMVVALNMMDVVDKSGDSIDAQKLSKLLGCPVVPICATKAKGIDDLMRAVESAAENRPNAISYDGPIEDAVGAMEALVPPAYDASMRRWMALKLLEGDEVLEDTLHLADAQKEQAKEVRRRLEKTIDDDAAGTLTALRYDAIRGFLSGVHRRKRTGGLTLSDKIDRVVTNRFLALPIFIAVIYLVYYISVSTLGSTLTDWANDGVFGDGWHLFGIGTHAYEEASAEYLKENLWDANFVATLEQAKEKGVPGASKILDAVEEEDAGGFEEAYGQYGDALTEAGFDVQDRVEAVTGDDAEGKPAPEEYGIWIPGIPGPVEGLLEKAGTPDWLNSLIMDGLIGGVGAVLGFVPQMFVLFFFLALLEGCGYMARVAFIMDRIFRRFGLSGKSFIPILISTGCGIPGIMACRTIENERDRRMTIMTATFIPCGAKIPIIAMIAAALFHGAGWVAPSAYFLGMGAIIISGIMLKKTQRFAGEPAPFVMELPPYHMPTATNVLRSMWERGWSFIKKAGTIILLSSILIWALSKLGFVEGHFGFDADMNLEHSLLGRLGRGLAWIFTPLGFANIKATVATVMGLVAKEEVVAVFGVLDFEGLTKLAAYAFLAFNLLCAPCFAAIGAIRREMNSARWTWFAILYQCAFAYVVALIIYQFGLLFQGRPQAIYLAAAVIGLIGILYQLFRPYREGQEKPVLRKERR